MPPLLLGVVRFAALGVFVFVFVSVVVVVVVVVVVFAVVPACVSLSVLLLLVLPCERLFGEVCDDDPPLQEANRLPPPGEGIAADPTPQNVKGRSGNWSDCDRGTDADRGL